MIKNTSKNNKIKGTKRNAKSIVITKDYIYYSTLSVATLKKRSSIFSTINTTDYYE